ncbi:MAG: galactose mutarotase [Oscillospiraceae bacterium]|nr:galactose mutarotase [Oscillospiraceae bacterium]
MNNSLKNLQRHIRGFRHSENILQEYHLENQFIKLTLTNAGAAIVKLEVADRVGVWRDVVLGFDDLSRYTNNSVYFGAIVGRFAGEISPPSFQWNRQEIQLCTDDRQTHLHGGKDSIAFRIWSAEKTPQGCTFRIFSPAGENGYPGNVQFYAKYILQGCAVHLEYGAVSDVRTPVNMLAHPYFNLNGHASGCVFEHELYLDANEYSFTSGEGLKTGTRYSCQKNTRYDFRVRHRLFQEPYDCNYWLKKENAYDAELYAPQSGIFLRMHCTQPCMQLYAACEMDEYGKDGAHYKPFDAICLEPQHQPNAMHIQDAAVPETDEYGSYRHTVIYEFGIR